MKNIAPNKILIASDLSDEFFEKNIGNDRKIEIKNISSGSVTLNGYGFVKSTGGAITYVTGSSSQFVKANGSLDSNTYLIGINSSQVTTALGYTPYNSTNPSGFITSASLSPYLTITSASNLYQPIGNYLTAISGSMVITALGYTPYNSTNPNGYISSGSVASIYAPLNSPMFTGSIGINGSGSISNNGSSIDIQSNNLSTGGLKIGTLTSYPVNIYISGSNKVTVGSNGNVNFSGSVFISGSASTGTSLNVGTYLGISGNYFVDYNGGYLRLLNPSVQPVISIASGFTYYDQNAHFFRANNGTSIIDFTTSLIQSYATKHLFGNQSDDGTSNQFVGAVKMKSDLTVNGNVGIGTSSPNAKLQVELPNSGIGIAFRHTGETNNTGLFFSTNESTRVSTIDASGSTSGILALSTSGAERVRVLDNGNVGIGTLTPLGILDVTSTISPSYPFPRMTTTQINAITGMSAGAFVFDTTTNHPKYYNGSSWVQL